MEDYRTQWRRKEYHPEADYAYPGSHGGEISVNGRISALLELGVSFHPDLTGRENIFINGAIFGLKQQEIKRKFDAMGRFRQSWNVSLMSPSSIIRQVCMYAWASQSLSTPSLESC